MKTKRRSLLALLLAAVLVLGLSAPAYAVTTEEIEELKAERDAIRAERAEKQAVVDQLAEEQAGIVERKKALDHRNTLTIKQMELNEKQIALYDAMIAEEAAKVDAALAIENEQRERYRTRVRSMEEHGGYNILALILRAESLADLLAGIDDISDIMESDRQIQREYAAAREHREEVKAQYEEFRAEFEGKQEELEAEQDMLRSELEEASALIAELQEDIDSHADELAALEAEEEAANAAVNALIAELEAQRRAEEEARRKEQEKNRPSGGGGSSGGGGTVGTGSFIWPVNCYYITSRMGWRDHPISGEYKYHSGTDIGAQYGAAVYAADGGTVCLAGENGGYGNCVMIDHGNGYYTLYGHLSSIAVSEGQSVSQGSVIGYVGSTGNSTGPHLHFEVRDSAGNKLDPESFFGGGFSYAPDAGN